MGLKLLELWTVVLGLSAVVNAARNQNCPPPVIENGFFIRELDTLSHDTELYYSCEENFKPVEDTWWATVTCQNGNWSSIPECIEDTACFDPEIPNANYTAFQYVKNNEVLWIKCNTGYKHMKLRATATCHNGTWSELPVCEKMVNSWCGPPPQIPNAVIINHGYEEMFPEDAYAEYMCRSNFELETNSNRADCSYGQWLTPPSCTSPDGNNQPLFMTIDKCGAPPPVQNGVLYYAENNKYVSYKCNYLYKLKGSRIVRCFNGNWTPPPTCEANFCMLDTSTRPNLENKGAVFIKSGDKMRLRCSDSNWRKARAECRDNQLYLSECCYWITHETNNCKYSQINPSQ